MTAKEKLAEIHADVQRALRLQDDPNYSDGEIYYPDSDDEPMAENEHQAIAMHYAFGALRVWFRSRDDVYVFMDMFVYYVEGDGYSVFAPDIGVVMGARGKHRRLSWFTWREGGIAPTLIIEFSSPNAWREDAARKRDLYAQLEVDEYWRIDPLGTLPAPLMIGERLVNGRYEPIDVRADESGVLRGRSDVLGLDMCVREDGEFRLYDPTARAWLLSMNEEAHDVFEQEVEARRRAEEEVRRLRELLEGRSGA